MRRFAAMTEVPRRVMSRRISPGPPGFSIVSRAPFPGSAFEELGRNGFL
jgi:hypothetical protein